MTAATERLKDSGRARRRSLATGVGLVGVGLGLAAIAAARGVRRWTRETDRRFEHLDWRQRDAGSDARITRIRKAITINRQPEVVFGFWRNFANLPRFMGHLESVETIDSRRSRWRARGPAGVPVRWTAEIVDERPNEYLAWKTLRGAIVANRGVVRFRPAPGARGTEVHVDIEYRIPGGRAAVAMARLVGEDPASHVAEDLRRLKGVLEAGEIARSEGSVSFVQPAQPMPHETRREHAFGKGVER